MRDSTRVRRDSRLWPRLVAPLAALAATALIAVAFALVTLAKGVPPADSASKAAAAKSSTRLAPFAPDRRDRAERAPVLDALPSAKVPPGNLKVFAAASLQNVLNEVVGAYELKHPGVHVVTGTGGSAELRAQIEQGADADVFLSADTVHVAALVRGGLCDTVRVFAHNRLAVLARKDGPVRALADLAMPGIRVVICAPDVPAGRYANQVLEKMQHAHGYGSGYVKRVKANLVSREINVRAAVTKVALGEADAAFAYVTDVELSKKKLVTIALSDTLGVRAVYGVALCKQGKNPIAAAEYLRFLQSAPVRAAFARHGFTP